MITEPLDDTVPTRLRTARADVITDPAEVDVIAACVEYGRAHPHWWQRLAHPAPAGWRQHHRGDITN